MALNGHSVAPDCTLIPSETKTDPTTVFLMVKNLRSRKDFMG